MQIANYLQARVLHSSTATFNLAMKNNKYLSFAEKIISVKNENAHCDIIKMHSDKSKALLTLSKIDKYESFLERISNAKFKTHQQSDYLSNIPPLPRLNVIKTNDNDHEYFLPNNSQPKLTTIRAAEERLI